MTKSKKAVMVTVRMTELEKSQLDYIREPGETQSACIRRLVNEKWLSSMSQDYLIQMLFLQFGNRFEHQRLLPFLAGFRLILVGVIVTGKQGTLFDRDRFATPELIFDKFRTAADAARVDDVVAGVCETTEQLALLS